MPRHYIITALKENHPFVTEEMKLANANKVLYCLEITNEEDESEFTIAEATKELIGDLALRVGDEVTIITDQNQAVFEISAVTFLQRRFCECIKITIKRELRKFTIPYLTTLRKI